MGVIRFAINNPVKVTVVVLLVAMFGVLSVARVPIQLTPNVDQPIVTVKTQWEGASPREVEREIVERQEEKLKSVSDLRKITSTSREGEAEITLEFHVGVDKDAALRDTIERINQVTGYPDEAERPEVVAAEASLGSPIAWIMFYSKTGQDVATYRDYVWDYVKPILERVKGVGSVDVYGGREREVQVRIDPAKLAARHLTFGDVADALQRQNLNRSAGTLALAKRDFTFRTVGQFEAVEDVAATVIAYRQGGPVYVRDVVKAAEPDGSLPGIEITHKKARSFVRSRGRPVLALPVWRESGSNVIKVMKGVKEQIAYVNRQILWPQGLGLELTQVYDETKYIHSAIGLVRNNLFIGGALAIAVLVLFLRSGSATSVVALSIPVSVVGTFLVVALLGRNLNVVMLAGMAFAVGMVVDNAIVVLENIFRHREMGESRYEAALAGTREVWGAVLASTLTTIAVFVPVLFIKEEAGQLFRDIAIAIATAVGLSMLVSVTVVPTLSARLLGGRRAAARRQHEGSGRFADLIARIVWWINRRAAARLALIVFLTVGSVLGSYAMVPPATYLPQGNRNLVFGYLVSPPGYSIPEYQRIASVVEDGDPGVPHDGLRAYWEADLGSKEAAALPPVTLKKFDRDVQVTPPPIDNFFFVSYFGGAFMGATSKQEDVVQPLINVLNEAGTSVPGLHGFFFQASLFGGVRAGGNSIDLEVRGPDLDEVQAAAEAVQGMLFAKIEVLGYARPEPTNFALGKPEVQAIPDRAKAADLGLTVSDVGFILAACVDGAYVGGFRLEGDEIDLVLRVQETQDRPVWEVASIPVYTTSGQIVPLSSAVSFVNTASPQQINHIEEFPSVSFEIRPPGTMALQEAMEIVEREIIQPLRQSGALNPRITTTLAGNADKLVQTRQALFGRWTGFNIESLYNLIASRGMIALIVTYLLMAALFESYRYPFIIMFSVPLATVGGFAALAVVHWASLADPLRPVQQFDVLTMLGFIILIGIVVNNAILIVHQSLNNVRLYGMEAQEAIRESVRTRVRPIFMTALTTVSGQLPLVLMPGAGSELYRGLGAVIVGGLLVSTVFTVFFVPAVFSLVLDVGAWLSAVVRGRPAAEAVRAPAPAARRPAAPEPAAAPARSGAGSS